MGDERVTCPACGREVGTFLVVLANGAHRRYRQHAASPPSGFGAAESRRVRCVRSRTKLDAALPAEPGDETTTKETTK